MSLTTYCPACGTSHAYTISKPKTCTACKVDMTKAFIPPVQAEKPKVNVIARTHQPLRNAMPKRPLDQKIRPFNPDQIEIEGATDEDFDGFEDEVDTGELEHQKQILASMINPEDFVVKPTFNKPITFGDLSNGR